MCFGEEELGNPSQYVSASRGRAIGDGGLEFGSQFGRTGGIHDRRQYRDENVAVSIHSFTPGLLKYDILRTAFGAIIPEGTC